MCWLRVVPEDRARPTRTGFQTGTGQNIPPKGEGLAVACEQRLGRLWLERLERGFMWRVEVPDSTVSGPNS